VPPDVVVARGTGNTAGGSVKGSPPVQRRLPRR